MKQHTPGPWTVGNIKQSNRPDANFPIEAFYDADGERFRATVAEIPTWSFDGVTDANREEHIANAALIASAPEMLAALSAIVSDYRALQGSQGASSSLGAEFTAGEWLGSRLGGHIARAESAISKAKGEA
jgi:hypothetical protein